MRVNRNQSGDSTQKGLLPRVHADTVFLNAHLIPVSGPAISGGALAVVGDRIAAVGTRADVEPLMGPGTRIIDCGGASLLPGFNDSHLHPLSQVRTANGLNLWDCRSLPEVLDQVQQRAAVRPPGEWIFSKSMQEQWTRGYPSRADLDRVAPHHPTLIVATSGHVASANSLALSLAGLSRETPDPKGGKFGRQPDGELDGILYESAVWPVRQAMPPETEESITRGLLSMARENLSRGITSLQEANVVSATELKAYQNAVAAGFPLRTYLMISHASKQALAAQLMAAGIRTGFGDHRLRIGPAKLFIDGDTGPGTAYMSEPYAKYPGNPGFPNYSKEEFDDLVEMAHRHGWQVATHAIGDLGADWVVDAYERALRLAPRANHRHRLEHGVTLRPETIRRMARLGIHLAHQSLFIWEFSTTELEVVGSHRERCIYPVADALAAGVTVSDGSDSPVVRDHSPLLGIYAAVTRDTVYHRPVNRQAAVSLEQAIRMYTWAGAYASFEETIKGTLEPGKLADLVLLSGDLLAAEPAAIPELKVDLTVIGGQVAFER